MSRGLGDVYKRQALYEGQKKRNNPGILLSVFTINKRSAIAYYHLFSRLDMLDLDGVH